MSQPSALPRAASREWAMPIAAGAGDRAAGGVQGRCHQARPSMMTPRATALASARGALLATASAPPCRVQSPQRSTMAALAAKATGFLAGAQKLRASSNGTQERLCCKSKGTYQASAGRGGPGPAWPAARARPRTPQSPCRRNAAAWPRRRGDGWWWRAPRLGGAARPAACRPRRRGRTAMPCTLTCCPPARTPPLLQVQIVVGDDEPQDNALKRFRREVMSAGACPARRHASGRIGDGQAPRAACMHDAVRPWRKQMAQRSQQHGRRQHACRPSPAASPAGTCLPIARPADVDASETSAQA